MDVAVKQVLPPPSSSSFICRHVLMVDKGAYVRRANTSSNSGKHFWITFGTSFQKLRGPKELVKHLVK